MPTLKAKKQGLFFANLRKLKNKEFIFLQTLKAKKQRFYCFFANFRKLKGKGFYFLQTLES